ncbi:MAG TPA: cytochrome c oxidase subunit II [Terrimicrobiaceae bacterium]
MNEHCHSRREDLLDPANRESLLGILKGIGGVAIAGVGMVGLLGCDGPQSALDPAGRAAEQIARLFWKMAAGTVLVWLIMAGLTFYATRGQKPVQERRLAKLLIIGGGAVIPTLILTVLLLYGLAMMPHLLARAPEGTLKIAVTGEQWWWRVRYQLPEGGEVVLANEIRLPLGEATEFSLESSDVIHSFWIPALGGKMDMIPGRTTRLLLEPTRAGIFRGVCAEYCGTSHALMAFSVVVMPPEEFQRWLADQKLPAREPIDLVAAKGRESFFTNGCSACHTVRGTSADGVVGPDLTHVGSRTTIGAGIFPNEPRAFYRWVERTHELKPGVQMPHFGMLPPQELHAIATYLESLQ